MPDDEIQEEDYLEGLCYFGGPEARLPTQVHIVAGLGIRDLIKALVIKNPSGPGIKTVEWTSETPIPDKVIGVVVDTEAIDEIQARNDGRGILLRQSNSDDWMTVDEWKDEFKTDGIAAIARMRLDWKKTGGGITKLRPDKKFVELGGRQPSKRG